MNLKKEKLSFFPVEEKHRDIILDWFDKAHVKEWFYGEGLENIIRNLDLFIKGIRNNGMYSFENWIAYIGDQPLGFLMTSLVEGPYNSNDPIDKWYEEGKETITLDLLIGPKEYLGQGLGHRMIQEFLLDKFALASNVLIDPEASNTKAIYVYEKAGFEKIEQFPQKHDDPRLCWMMHLKIDDLKKKSIFLSTKQLTLRQVIYDDIEVVADLANDYDIAVMMNGAMPFPYTVENAKEWITKHGEDHLLTSAISWAITEKVYGRVIGSIQLRLDTSKKCARISYWIGKSYWNHGYASEAVNAVVEFGFDKLHLDEINAEYFESNTQSKRVLEKAGFKFISKETKLEGFMQKPEIFCFVSKNPESSFKE